MEKILEKILKEMEGILKGQAIIQKEILLQLRQLNFSRIDFKTENGKR